MNNEFMTNFDQLIKEKAESTTYPYKEKYWKAFASQVGIQSSVSGLKIALFSVTGAGVIGLSIFFSINSKQPSQTPPTTAIEKEIFIKDTLNQDIETLNIDSNTLSQTETENLTVVKKNRTDYVPSPKSDDKEKNTARKKIDQKNEKEDRSKWRILTIDPDTIKSND